MEVQTPPGWADETRPKTGIFPKMAWYYFCSGRLPWLKCLTRVMCFKTGKTGSTGPSKRSLLAFDRYMRAILCPVPVLALASLECQEQNRNQLWVPARVSFHQPRYTLSRNSGEVRILRVCRFAAHSQNAVLQEPANSPDRFLPGPSGEEFPPAGANRPAAVFATAYVRPAAPPVR